MILAQIILGIPVITGITMSAAASLPRDLAWQLRGLGGQPMASPLDDVAGDAWCCRPGVTLANESMHSSR
jgi:hypothetical protein